MIGPADIVLFAGVMVVVIGGIATIVFLWPPRYLRRLKQIRGRGEHR